MKTDKPYDTQEQLERILDRIGLQNVLEVLAILCDEKSEHLDTNFRSKDAWQHDARVIDAAVKKLR